MRTLAFGACDCLFHVDCPDARTAELLGVVFSGLARPVASAGVPARTYRIRPGGPPGGFVVSDGEHEVAVDDDDDLLFHIDKEITVALQRLRSDLFFLHAGAVARSDRAALLIAPPGTGKSTLTFALLERGFEYLSDELSPIDLGRMVVHPYAHALCLKSAPPPPYALPGNALRCGTRYHLPVAGPGEAREGCRPVVACVFLRRDGERFEGLRRLSAGSAVARIMANALNPLAHPGDGLDAAIELSRRVDCYELDISDIVAGVDLIQVALRPADRRE